MAAARTTYAISPLPTTFIEDDLLRHLTNEPQRDTHQSPDIIMAGYAIHHLSLPEKRRFFTLAHSLLSQEGTLIFYDIFRRPGENPEEYVSAYLGMMKAYWGLTPERLDGTSRHIQDCDFPETQETISHLARDAGFTAPPQELFADQHGFHRLFVFMK